MSRTYRRIDRKVPNWVDHEWRYIDGGYLERRKLEGHELKRSMAMYHSDHDYGGPSRWWRKNEWHKFRSQARQELIRWFKDEEHEIQIRDNPRWPWWD